MKACVYKWTTGAGWRAESDEVEPGLVVYFYDRLALAGTGAIAALASRFPKALVTGCTTAGEIAGSEMSVGGACALAMEFSNASVRHAVREITDKRASREAGRELAAELKAHDLRGILLLSDGTIVNGSELAEGLLETLGDRVPVFGGLAGDGERFEATEVGLGSDLRDGRIVAVGFFGEALDVVCASGAGWQPFGPQRLVTRSEGNVLVELDGEPALAVYKKYLGERAAELPASALLFPLQIHPKGLPAEAVVRTILSVDEERQTMLFAGDVPEGFHARFMHAGTERLVAGAGEAGSRAAGAFEGAQAALVVSCVGRRLVLKQRADEELTEVQNAAGACTPMIGFYSYGELSPGLPGCATEFQNQTIAMMLFRESPVT